MTKTLIDIDDELLAKAMRALGVSTKKSAVELALREVLRRQAAVRYVDYLGTGATVDLNDAEVVAGAQR